MHITSRKEYQVVSLLHFNYKYCGKHRYAALNGSRLNTVTRTNAVMIRKTFEHAFVCFFVWFVGFLTSSSTTRLYRGRAPRQSLTILRAATHEIELGDHDFCLSRSHYTDTDPTSRERAATAGIEPETSSSGVVRSTD